MHDHAFRIPPPTTWSLFSLEEGHSRYGRGRSSGSAESGDAAGAGPWTLLSMAELRFLGAIRKAAGTATFGIDAGTVEELLEKLRGLMGPGFQELVFHGQELKPDVEVMVNGRSVASPDALKTALAPFDQVTLSLSEVRRLPGG